MYKDQSTKIKVMILYNDIDVIKIRIIRLINISYCYIFKFRLNIEITQLSEILKAMTSINLKIKNN